ncbi:YrbL family protein [Gymnodinialimonas ulvae]|uniref:YrbL family protein n=1 Tax=Gymnodinialimonas ulvae TaxID=3126504 RepID=UPI0030A8658C
MTECNAGSHVVELSDDLLIGRRQTRSVYRHPERDDLVLKIETGKAPGRKRWYERKPRIASSMERELRGYANLMARLGTHRTFVARIYGLEQTSLGPAILAENATHGAEAHAVLRDLLKDRVGLDLTPEQMRFVARRYAEIGDLLTDHRVFTHGIRPENFMVLRNGDALELRVFDHKTNVYRQLISPRFVPGAERYEQRRKMNEVQALFDAWFERHGAGAG